MGKMPLAGLLGLVTALTLVTAGCKCGDSCHRREGKFKPSPAFPTPGKTEMVPPVPPAGAPADRDPPPPPSKPTDPPPPPAPGPSGNSQSNLAPIGSPPPVQSLSPRHQGWDDRSMNDGLKPAGGMAMPTPPISRPVSQNGGAGVPPTALGASNPPPAGPSQALPAITPPAPPASQPPLGEPQPGHVPPPPPTGYPQR
jgi:hypothetical protein